MSNVAQQNAKETAPLVNVFSTKDVDVSGKSINYGTDAPYWSYGMTLLGLSLIAVTVVLMLLGQSFSIWIPFVCSGVPLLITGGVMLLSSWNWKIFYAAHVVSQGHTWTGAEKVLDVGCGHGLMLISAARYLSKEAGGSAIGVDLWSSWDQGGNSPQKPLTNAVLEGVGDLVTVQTADGRQLPFADSTFDVIVSSYVVHNLSKFHDREKMLHEMVRVLKPEGDIILTDILRTGEMADVFRQAGLQVKCTWFVPLFMLPTRTVLAHKPPHTSTMTASSE